MQPVIIFDVMQGTLILITGLIGAGKTTLGRRLATERNAILLSPDAWIEAILEDPRNSDERDRMRGPVENLQWDLAREWLQKGLTVILDNGFWACEERYQYAMEALEVGARIELYYVAALGTDALWERVQKRNSESPYSAFVITEEEMLRGWNTFDVPSDEELEFYDDWGRFDWNLRRL